MDHLAVFFMRKIMSMKVCQLSQQSISKMGICLNLKMAFHKFQMMIITD